MKCRSILIPPYPLTRQINAGGALQSPPGFPETLGTCWSLHLPPAWLLCPHTCGQE